MAATGGGVPRICYHPATPPRMLGPGAQPGPYKLVAEIGAGGMGQIFRAVDTASTARWL